VGAPCRARASLPRPCPWAGLAAMEHSGGAGGDSELEAEAVGDAVVAITDGSGLTVGGGEVSVGG
jgi:hypothetical protein